MAKIDPAQAVKQRFGSKDKLVSQLVSNLKPYAGESVDEFESRLLIVSDRKLLRLENHVGKLMAEGNSKAANQAIRRVCTKLTPMYDVQQKFGGKEKLVSQLVSALQPYEGESTSEFKERLLKVSNRKLLRLAGRVESLKAEGGFDKLAESVTQLEGGNQDRLAKNKAKTLGALLDRKQALS